MRVLRIQREKSLILSRNLIAWKNTQTPLSVSFFVRIYGRVPRPNCQKLRTVRNEGTDGETSEHEETETMIKEDRESVS